MRLLRACENEDITMMISDDPEATKFIWFERSKPVELIVKADDTTGRDRRRSEGGVTRADVGARAPAH